jgi:hypothetical protein
MNFPIAPSFLSLVITGILLLFIFFIFIKNWKPIMQLNYYQKMVLLSLISIAIAAHGNIHLGLENSYGFNPLNFFEYFEYFEVL